MLIDHESRVESTSPAFPVVYKSCLSCGQLLTTAEKEQSQWRCFCSNCLDWSRNLCEWDDIGVGD